MSPEAPGGRPRASIRIGLVQMRVTDGRPRANLDRVRNLVRDADPADLYVVPELFTTGYAYDAWPDAARDAGRAVELLRSLAAERGATIAAGTIAVDSGGDLVNRLWLVGPSSDPVTYDKGHLFAPLQEDTRLARGETRQTAEVGGWRTGLSICFDLRFPGIYRQYALDGCTCFLVVSQWPAARADILRTLARARAIENQTFLALCNRTGPAADGTAHHGGSALIAPDGRVIADAGAAEGVVIATASPDALTEARDWIDLLALRRPGLDG